MPCISKLKFVLIFQMLLFLSSACTAQTDYDSLRLVWNNNSLPDSARFKAINEYALDGVFSYPDTILPLAAYHYELAALNDNKLEMALAIENRAFALSVLARYDEAIEAMTQVLALAKEIGDEDKQAANYSNMGNMHYYKSDFQKAIEYHTKSLAVYEDKNMEAPMAEVLINLGLVYYEINSWDKALAYFNRALALYKKLGVEKTKGNIWLNIGYVHLKKESNTLAIDYGQKAEKILQLTNNIFSAADCYFLYSRAYQNLGQLDSARVNAQKCLELSIEIGNTERVLSDKILLAELELDRDLNIATRTAEEMLPAVMSLSNNTLKVDVHDLLYKAYKKQGKYNAALEMHEEYQRFYDSLLVEESHVAVIKESIKSEYDIKLVKEKIENNKVQAELKLSQFKKTIAIVSIGLLLILSILYFLFSSIKTHKQQQQKLLTEIEELKKAGNATLVIHAEKYELDREKIEATISNKLNETDWTVLNILLDDPVISNKDIATKAFMSVDGIGSSLRRMYSHFDIKESKYKKISLIMGAIKISNN